MPSFDTRLFVLDTETTGTNPAEDRIVELAGVYFEKGAYVSHRQMLVDPGRTIPAEASAVHHISDAMVQGKPKFADIAAAFISHLNGTAMDGVPPVLAGYNAITFDVPLLNAEFERAGHVAVIDDTRVVDPVVFVRYYLRHLRKRTLTDMVEHFGITLESAHRASADARATGELLLAMVKAGHIPDDVEAALAMQARLRDIVEAEWAEFSYWLYRDREDGALRFGAGKHCGERLDRVDPGYVKYLLATISDLPARVRDVLSAPGA